jgi:pyruvate/2-oxoglutarate/acetoin dehydrogenase E1 component
MAHSKGDDHRPKDYISRIWLEDPLTRLLEDDEFGRSRLAQAEASFARLAQVIAARPLLEDSSISALPGVDELPGCMSFHADAGGGKSYGRIAEVLNQALHELMGEDPNIILVGEDLLDPYGGAFKVARGLSTAYPNQVHSTPISEAGLTGLSNGMALAGMRPIAEIMFADFVTLAADQLINFTAKYHAMYGGKVNCPLTVRLVSGGGRGYGPTHSQSLESLFCGVPGLRVVALSQRHDPRNLLRHAVLADPGPKLFVEHKLLYALRPHDRPPLDLEPVVVQVSRHRYPPLYYRARTPATPTVTIVTYGGMTGTAEAAMHKLLVEQEFSFDYIILTQLWPLDVTEIVASVQRTRRLLVVEENVPDFNLGAAVIAAVAQQIPDGFACRAVGARPVPLPCARHLEECVLPSPQTVAAALASIGSMRN